MHEVSITFGTNGHNIIDLDDQELYHLLADWGSKLSDIIHYKGFHRDYEDGKDIVRPANLWIIPATITNIQANTIVDSR